jgi:hypothetical protein
VIASPSESHREIQSLHDFQDLVWICDTRDPLDWSIAMKDLAAAQLARTASIAEERHRRLERYDALEAQVFEQFRSSICKQVLGGIRSEMATSGAHD